MHLKRYFCNASICKKSYHPWGAPPEIIAYPHPLSVLWFIQKILCSPLAPAFVVLWVVRWASSVHSQNASLQQSANSVSKEQLFLFHNFASKWGLVPRENSIKYVITVLPSVNTPFRSVSSKIGPNHILLLTTS